MRTIFGRCIAVMLLAVPGLGAAYGCILMKDAILRSFGPQGFPWGTFVVGALLCIVGVAFIGGWIFYRDRKRNYVAPRFRKKRPRNPPTTPPRP